jgi:hypothetical protein
MSELQIEGFLDKYSPPIAAQARACRSRMQTIIGRGYELIYDNYNALVFGFATFEKTSSAVISIAIYPRWVTLFFLHGTDLDDPRGLLEGTGKQVRSIRLKSPEDLDRPDVREFIDAAMADSFASAPALTTIVKSVSAKQRPRI